MLKNPNIQFFLDNQPALCAFLLNFLRHKPPESNIYLVGGIVRDLLCGLKKQKDIDLMVDCANENTIKNLLKLLKQQRTILTWQKVGRSFPVFKLNVPGIPEELDFALARTEQTTGTGHRDFSFLAEKISAADDARRRDFTVNALFCRVYMEENKIQHEILDFYTGLSDLQDRLLRCVGETTARFTEDPLRMLRAIRFTRKGFRLHNDISSHILKMAAELLPTLSKERIHDEFLRAMQADLHATHNDYKRFRLYPICFPGINHLLPETDTELPEINQQPEREIIFAIILAPFLINKKFKPEPNFHRNLEKKLNDLRTPNPGKIRSALSTFCKLALLPENNTPIAMQEKILNSPQGPDGLYLYQLYRQKTNLPELHNISTPPERLPGQFFIKSGFRPGPGFEELLLFARELQWHSASPQEVREKLQHEFPDYDYSRLASSPADGG
jgi:tRNA nucleotidyltransferase/poly(A) polymerase